MARDERSFDEFTRARLPHLLMLARTLTCDERSAKLLVEECLAPVLDRWDESSPFTAEEEVRRSLVRTALRRTSSPAPTDDPVWSALATLSSRERSALALRLHEDLTDEQAADVLDCTPAAARDAAETAIAAVDVDATRQAVLEPVPVDEVVMNEVRSLAARRRRRRTILTAAVALVAALALGVVVVATAGGTDTRGLEYDVLVMDATSADTVWAMTRGDDCPGCTALWKGGESGEWELVYTFRVAAIRASLLMSPDGKNGFAWFASDHVEATHDGGTTWVVPDLEAGGAQVSITIAGDRAYAYVVDDGFRLMTSQLGSDDWAEVPVDRPGELTLVPFRDGLLLHDRSDDGGDYLVPADDQDQRWPTPCTERDVVSSGEALWTTCQAGDDQRVMKSTDGRTWSDFATVSDAAAALYPVSDDTLLMRTFSGAALVTADSAEAVDLGLGSKDTIASAVFPTAQVGYMRSYAGAVLRSPDGGVTWTKIS